MIICVSCSKLTDSTKSSRLFWWSFHRGLTRTSSCTDVRICAKHAGMKLHKWHKSLKSFNKRNNLYSSGAVFYVHCWSSWISTSCICYLLSRPMITQNAQQAEYPLNAGAKEHPPFQVAPESSTVSLMQCCSIQTPPQLVNGFQNHEVRGRLRPPACVIVFWDWKSQ